MKKIMALILVMGLVLSLVGCADNDTPAETTKKVADKQTEKQTEASTEAKTAELSGTLNINGSTSVEKIGKAMAVEFMALHPGVTVNYEGTGSSSGVKAAGNKTADIGTASRNIKDSEKADYGMDEMVLAFDGIAVIAHPSNGIEELTMEQVMKIYKGEITNWKDVGGEDKAIAVVSREESSGTRGAFEELVDFEDALTGEAQVVEGNGGVQATVAGNVNAIGYVSFTYIDDSIKPINIEGAAPTVENVLAKTYPISRPFNMVYYEAELSDIAKAFIEYAMSDDGQMIVDEKGGIPVK